MSAPPFTERQLQALDISRRHLDACVVAGPGAGKTTVLVEYFRRLVEAGSDPGRILAITFTEKAAAQMRRRLADAFREDAATRGGLERAWVSTVHGFCARLLKENAVTAGVDPQFSIAEEREFGRWQQESLSAAIESLFHERPAAVRAMIRGLSSFTFEEAVLTAYDAMRGAGQGIDLVAARPAPPGTTLEDIAGIVGELRRECDLGLSGWNYAQKQEFACTLEALERIVSSSGPREALTAIAGFDCNLQKCRKGTRAHALLKELKAQRLKELQYTCITELYVAERHLLIEILRRFDRAYRQRKSQAGALDFADLEEFSVNLLENSPETCARLQDQFDHVLMDELQDTNGQQARLLRLLRPPGRFYAVGDLNQAIFGFRHADPAEFESYRCQVAGANGRLVELIENFRSRPEILRAVETVVEGAEGIVKRRLIAGRTFTDREWRQPRVELLVAGEPDTEGRMVARRLAEFLAAEPQFSYRDVALLVRNTEVLPHFTDALDESGIPFVVSRGKGFYEAREVNDLAQLLRVIANPRDEISLAAVLRSPLVEASDEALLRLRMTGANIGSALMRLDGAADFEAADLLKLVRFRDRLRGWRRRREYVSFDRLLLDAMDECGYPAIHGSRAAANIEKFLAQARAAAGRTSLDGFVRDLELLRQSNRPEQDAAPDDASDAVQVMTIHSAKGLEFPIVFLAALHKGVEGKPPVVAYSPRHGLGASWRNPAAREEKDDLFQREIRTELKEREEREGHRLLYVAMTRAEQHLVLSFSTMGKKPAKWARLVVESLGVELEPGERQRELNSPYGEPWSLRVLVATASDAPHAAPARGARHPAPEREALELLEAPEVTGQYDGNATVTALRCFARCPREYYLGHYLGFESSARKTGAAAGDLAASELGNQVHALLAGIQVADPDPQAVRLAETFRKGPLGRRVERALRVEREFDFVMAVDDLVLRGQMDLWFEEAGQLVIVDYKTDAVSAADAQQRSLDYVLQLRLYAVALERIAGRAPDRAYLHFLKPNTVVEVDLSPSLIDSPEQVVREFTDAQDRLEFPLREGEHCERCVFYKDLCPATWRRKPLSSEPPARPLQLQNP